MKQIALMLEGQDGLNWERWQNVARLAEDEGFVGLYRSDHFTNPSGPYRDSLECWTSLTWLATHTSRLEFGPMVSPMSFHHPSNLVRVASAVADLSGGRLQFGIGAGWSEREHTNYGFSLGNVPERMARFKEATEIMAHLLRSDEPLTYNGKCFTLRDAVLLPRPEHRVPIVIGGGGRLVTLPLVARYADEWNALARTVDQFAEINGYLDGLLDKIGRPVSEVRRSVMLFLRFGRDQAELNARLDANPVPERIRNGTLTATADDIKERVESYFAAGVERLILNWRDDYDDLRGMKALARAVL